MYGNVHNIFIDHINHSGESNQHHHHGPGDNDILIHHHDDGSGHDYYKSHKHYLDNDGEYNIIYGRANHNHDEPATEADDYDDRDGSIGNDDFTGPNYYITPPTTTVSTTRRDDYDYNIDWADNIDNVTGGDPYGHNKK